MKCVAEEMRRVDNDYMTFSVKEEGEVLTRAGPGHRELCRKARSVFSKEIRRSPCIHSGITYTTLYSSFLLAVHFKTQSKKLKIKETNFTMYFSFSLQF